MAQVFIDIKAQSNLEGVAKSISDSVASISESLKSIQDIKLNIDTSGLAGAASSIQEIGKSIEDLSGKIKDKVPTLDASKPADGGAAQVKPNVNTQPSTPSNVNKVNNSNSSNNLNNSITANNIRQVTGLFSYRISSLVSTIKPAAGPLLALTAALAAVKGATVIAKNAIEDLNSMYSNALTAVSTGLKESDVAKYEFMMSKLGAGIENGAKYAQGVSNLYAKARQGNAEAQQLIAEIGNTADIRLDWLKENVSEFSEKFTVAVSSINKKDIDTGKFARITAAIGSAADVLANKKVSNPDNIRKILGEANASQYGDRSIIEAGGMLRSAMDKVSIELRKAASDFFSSDAGKDAIKSVADIMDSFADLIKTMVASSFDGKQFAETIRNISSIVRTAIDAVNALGWVLGPVISFIGDFVRSIIYLGKVILDVVKLIGAALDDVMNFDLSMSSSRKYGAELVETFKNEPRLNSDISKAIASPAQLAVDATRSATKYVTNNAKTIADSIKNSFTINIAQNKDGRTDVKVTDEPGNIGNLEVEKITYNGAY